MAAARALARTRPRSNQPKTAASTRPLTRNDDSQRDLSDVLKAPGQGWGPGGQGDVRGGSGPHHHRQGRPWHRLRRRHRSDRSRARGGLRGHHSWRRRGHWEEVALGGGLTRGVGAGSQRPLALAEEHAKAGSRKDIKGCSGPRRSASFPPNYLPVAPCRDLPRRPCSRQSTPTPPRLWIAQDSLTEIHLRCTVCRSWRVQPTVESKG